MAQSRTPWQGITGVIPPAGVWHRYHNKYFYYCNTNYDILIILYYFRIRIRVLLFQSRYPACPPSSIAGYRQGVPTTPRSSHRRKEQSSLHLLVSEQDLPVVPARDPGHGCGKGSGVPMTLISGCTLPDGGERIPCHHWYNPAPRPLIRAPSVTTPISAKLLGLQPHSPFIRA